MRVVNVFARRFRRYVFRVPNPNPRGVPIGFQVGNHQALVTQHAFISRYAVSAVVSLTVPIAFASHGSWQVLTAFPFLLPQASDKSQPRPFPAVLMPFAGAWLRQSLCGPQVLLHLAINPHAGGTFRWPEPWLGMGCPYFGHRLRI